MSNRSIFAICAVALSLVILAMLWASAQAPDIAKHQGEIEERVTAAATPFHGSSPDLNRTEEHQALAIVVVDALSGNVIEGLDSVEVRLDREWEAYSLSNQSEAAELLSIIEDNPWRSNLRFVVPSIPSGLEVECPIGMASLEDAEQGYMLRLPALPRVSVTAISSATAQAIPDASVRVSVVDREHWQEYEAEVLAEDVHRLHPIPSNLPDSILARYRHFSKERGSKLLERWLSHDQDSPNPAGSAPASGLAVLLVHAPGHSSAMLLDDLHPLETADHLIELAPKPTIFGILSSPRPLDNYTVSVAVQLDNEGTDFAMREHQEGFSLTGKRLETGETIRVARTQVGLDDLGRFEKRLPYGKRYLVEIRGKHVGKYLSEELSLQQVLDSEFQPLEWNLGDSEKKYQGVTFEVIPPDGLSVANARLLISPKNDEPWFRVFPKVYCDENGVAKFPWANPGDLLFVTVFLDKGQGSKGFPTIMVESTTLLDMR